MVTTPYPLPAPPPVAITPLPGRTIPNAPSGASHSTSSPEHARGRRHRLAESPGRPNGAGRASGHIVDRERGRAPCLRDAYEHIARLVGRGIAQGDGDQPVVQAYARQAFRVRVLAAKGRPVMDEDMVHKRGRHVGAERKWLRALDEQPHSAGCLDDAADG